MSFFIKQSMSISETEIIVLHSSDVYISDIPTLIAWIVTSKTYCITSRYDLHQHIRPHAHDMHFHLSFGPHAQKIHFARHFSSHTRDHMQLTNFAWRFILNIYSECKIHFNSAVLFCPNMPMTIFIKHLRAQA